MTGKTGRSQDARWQAGRSQSARPRRPSLLRCCRGVAAVEFALAAPVLVGLLVPLADLGIAYSHKVQVQQAAQAGAQYAVLHPWDSNSPATIAGVVVSATGLPGITASPAPAQYCGCPADNTIALHALPCGTCSGGTPEGYYVVVSAQAAYASPLPYSLLGRSVVLSAQTTVRVR